MFLGEKCDSTAGWLILSLAWLMLCNCCCSKAPSNQSTGDTDVDSDTDSDTDTDTDTDADLEELLMEMVPIEAGSFWMGSPDGNCPKDYPGGSDCVAEPWRDGDEKLHYVTLTRPFEIQKMETVRRDFEIVMHRDPNTGLVSVPEEFYNYPADNVKFYEALVYSNEVSRREKLPHCFILTDIVCMDNTIPGPEEDDTYCSFEGHYGVRDATVTLNGVKSVYDCAGYRLPTEAEWEYATRAGSITAFHPSEGNDGSITQFENDPNLTQIGWERGNSGDEFHPVGDKEPNAWGLYDMSGNSEELVYDDFEEYPDCDTQNPCIDPVVVIENMGQVRGGKYYFPAPFARSANRYGSSSAGCRLVKTIHK